MNTDLQALFGAINAGLNTIKTIAAMPGVNMIPYANTIAGGISVLQLAIEAGQNIAPYVVAFTETFSGDAPPSQDQLDALDAKIAELEAKLDAPMPPKEDGEPE
jgi:hypothetical protein